MILAINGDQQHLVKWNPHILQTKVIFDAIQILSFFSVFLVIVSCEYVYYLLGSGKQFEELSDEVMTHRVTLTLLLGKHCKKEIEEKFKVFKR